MHDTTTYRATFSGLIMTAFGKDQTMKYRAELEMYQACDSPSRWRVRPALETGRHKWEASSPVELARIVEADWVQRETNWTIVQQQAPRLPRPRRSNVVQIDRRRRA